MKKKLNLILSLCLGFFTAVNAAEYESGEIVLDDYCMFTGCQSCTNYVFDMQFRVLYMQPTGSHLNYAAQAIPLPLPSPNWKIYDVDTDYHVGFDIGLKGICCDRNTNIKLNWAHLKGKDSDSRKVSSQNMIGPFFEIGPDAAFYTKAKGTATFHYDQINLDYGVNVNCGCSFWSDCYVGLAAARIKQTVVSKYSNEDETVFRSIKAPCSFNGIGPQFGVDFSYAIIDCLNLSGGASASLLVGSVKNHTTYKSVSPFLVLLGITPPNKQSTSTHSRSQVVPGFEGRLGLSYHFSLCKLLVNIEAGYEAKIYINAIQSVDMGSEVVTPPLIPDAIGVFARTFDRNLSNFALAGPYLTLGAIF